MMRENELLFPNNQEGFSFMIAVAFTLNYIMGTGFLTLPWAFHQTGILLGSVTLAGTCLIAIMAVLFLLESISRGQLLITLPEQLASVKGSAIPSKSTPISSKDILEIESKATLQQNDDRIIDHLLYDVKIEIPELCEIFLGVTMRRTYTTFLAIYMYGSLWGYSSVFANAFSSHIPIGDESYLFYLSLFGIMVVPATCMELSEQIFVQMTLAWGRVFMVVLMVSTVIGAQLAHSDSFGTFNNLSSGEVSYCNLNKLYLLLPVAMYAGIFHHSVPALSEPVIDKSQLGNIYTLTLILCFLAYTFLSVFISSYFGDNVMVSSNLNWASYTAIDSSSSTSTDLIVSPAQAPWYATLISFYVVLFPALDVASAFPLNGITLGNNLMSTYYGKEMHLVENSRTHRIRFRVLAAVPCIIAAAFVSDLGVITDYTGITGFAIALIFPALLTMNSRVKMQRLGLPYKTKFSSTLTSPVAVWFVLLFGVALIIFVFVSLIMNSK